jgi:hypothetical protein
VIAQHECQAGNSKANVSKKGKAEEIIFATAQDSGRQLPR